ncbi:MAG: L-fucose mutarotase [Verrucomicrobiales bacterium]|nr:L-fucose mutarotase [Verrucomicrobiales bacterium]MED5585139.1 L-fucose mutarotase [Verrucomicrobiota bacterium]
MLVGISPLISPTLLETLHRMGHGDEVVLADAHFPSESLGPRCIRADGLLIQPLLKAILPLLALDSYDPSPVTMMAVVPGDTADSGIEKSYQTTINQHWPETPQIEKIERFGFYERASKAFAIVATGDSAKYANIILKKGVTPVT